MRDPVLRTMVIALAIGLTLLGFVLSLWIGFWPNG